MPVDDHNGQINEMSSANYFSYSNREYLPHNSSAMFPPLLVTQQDMPTHNIYGRNNDVSDNYFDPSLATQNANRPERVPFGFSSSYAIPNAHDSATFGNHGRVNEFLSSTSTPPYYPVACS
jgi:hypothetical protein